MAQSHFRRHRDIGRIGLSEQRRDLESYSLSKGDLVYVYIPDDLDDPETKFTTYVGIVLQDSEGIACFIHVFYDNQSYYVHWQQVEKV